MNRIIVGTVAAAAALAASLSALQAQAPARTVWDGVYSADQAAAGKTLFDAKCAMCHGPQLTGNEMAPPLAGSMFLGNWSGQSLGDLATRIHTTMPADNPGSLTDKEVSDSIAYILSFNQFPAGSNPLPADPSQLSQITIVTEKPAGK